MTEDEAAQQARARELRAEIERLKRGSADDVDAGVQPADDDAEVQPADEPDAATDANGGSDEAEADPDAATSVRDWINKRMAETPFEEEPDDGESPGAAKRSAEKDAGEADQG